MVACSFTDVVWSDFCNTPSCQNVYFEIKDVVLLEECCVILSAHLRIWYFFLGSSIYINTAEIMIVVSKGFSAHVLILISWSVQQCNSLL
jgi:hypothetical protein